MKIKKDIIAIFEEECDCYEKYGKCLHNNGGHYHDTIKRYKFDIYDDNEQIDSVLIDVVTESRDFLSGDIYLTLVYNPPKKYFAVIAEEYDVGEDMQYVKDVIAYKDSESLINCISDISNEIQDKVIGDYYSGQTVILDTWTTDSYGLTQLFFVEE